MRRKKSKRRGILPLFLAAALCLQTAGVYAGQGESVKIQSEKADESGAAGESVSKAGNSLETKAAFGMEDEAGTGTDMESETAEEAETQVQIPTGTEGISGTESEGESGAPTGPETNLWPETEGWPETEIWPEGEPGIPPETGQEPETGIETETEPDAGADTDFQTEPGPEGEPGSDVGLEPQSDSEIWDGSGTEFESETQTESEAAAETELETDLETETETETETQCTCGGESKNGWEHEWNCPVFEKEVREVCDCGEGTGDLLCHDYQCASALTAYGTVCKGECSIGAAPIAFHQGDCPALRKLRDFLCDCGIPETDFTAHMGECLYFLYMKQAREHYESQVSPLLDFNLPASGVSVAGVSGFTPAPKALESSVYRPVKLYPGISSISTFPDNPKDVTVARGTKGILYLYPRTDSVRGYGARYHKVLYYNNEWYDLKMTVMDFSTKSYATDGKQVNSRPFVGFLEKNIGWAFNGRTGESILKIEFVKTGTDTPVRVNTRFQWKDIDSAQRFGIRLSTGSFAARYYHSEGTMVNYEREKVAHDTSPFDIFVGHGENLAAADARGNITLVLQNCSAYYIALGFQDHIDESTDYRSSRTNIEKWNKALASGDVDNMPTFGDVVQTDSGLSVIDAPDPVKMVSGDGKTWGTENTLSGLDSAYYYRIEQFVPWNDTVHKYRSFVIRDVLPKGAAYAGNLSVVRTNDGRDVTGSFQVSTENGQIVLTAGDGFKNSQDYYGCTYQVTFQVRLDPGLLSYTEQDGVLKYELRNQASLEYQNNGGDPTVKKSNEVLTRASAQRAVRLRVTKVNKDTGEAIQNAGFGVYEWNGSAYGTARGRLSYDGQNGWYTMENLKRTGVNQGKYKIVEEEVPPGFAGGWEQEILVPEMPGIVDLYYHVENAMAKGTITVEKTDDTGKAVAGALFEITAKENICSPQGKVLALAGAAVGQMRTDGQGRAVSTPLYPGKYLVTEKEAPLGYQKQDTPMEAVIAWKDKDTPLTNTVLKMVNKRAVAKIRLVKEIRRSDIVWAHGNPIFLFCLTGQDVFGREHTFYEAVEFTKTQEQSGDILRRSVEFAVPSGIYTALEEPVIRYELSGIRGVKQGAVQGEKVEFDVTQILEGEAVFVNEKVTDEGESHTALVKNHFGK